MTDALRRLVLLLVVAAISGLALAGIALPFVAGPGLVSNAAVKLWQSEKCGMVEQPPLPQRTRIVAADGSPIADFYYQNRQTVTFEQIPQVMRNAIVAVEDSRFYEHNGVDLQGILRALVTNGQAGQIREGGSTLTQQYVKNIFLLTATNRAEQEAATADTLARKLREAKCALDLEKHMSKSQILTGYLNIAYFGEGAYGVAAAAQRYFGTPVERITLAQAAMLAGIVKNPSAYDPILHPQAARDRRDTVLQRMIEVGYLTPTQEQAGLRSALGLHVRPMDNGCETSRAPYFCEWVVDLVQSSPAFGDTVTERTQALLRGGLTIRTTLDWRVQRAAERAVQRYVPGSRKLNPRGIASAVVVVQPGTGAVKAMAVNLPYGTGKGQNSNNLALGGSLGYQAGSTFKMFTLVTALERHIPISLRIFAPQHYCSKVTPDYSCTPPHIGVYNAGDSEQGVFDLVSATADSVNTYFVQLIERIGVLPVVHTAELMGIDFTKFGQRRPGPADASVTLGGWNVTPLEMAEAYATLAARGKYCPAFGLLEVRNADGAPVHLPTRPCSQVVSQPIADTATQILTHVINGPGGHTGGNAYIGRPAAGKTGTTNNYGAAWFDGYTPQLAAAVWVGDPKGIVPGLRGFTLDGGPPTRDHMFGGDEPAMIWAATMKGALAALHLAPVEFPPANPIVEFGNSVDVPDVTGLSVAAAEKALQAAGLTGQVAPTAVPSSVPAGLVALTGPVAGTRLGTGSVVLLYLSTGVAPHPSTTPPTTPPTTHPPTPQPTPGRSKPPTPSPTPTPTPTRTHHHSPGPPRGP